MTRKTIQRFGSTTLSRENDDFIVEFRDGTQQGEASLEHTLSTGAVFAAGEALELPEDEFQALVEHVNGDIDIVVAVPVRSAR